MAEGSAADSPHYSINTRPGEAFDLGDDPWSVLAKVEHNVPLADWRRVINPRVLSPACEYNLDMMVRSYAEHESSSLNRQTRGPRLTAHKVCELTGQVNYLNQQLLQANQRLAGTEQIVHNARQEILRIRAHADSELQRFQRQIQALEDKFDKHLPSQQDALQPQAEPPSDPMQIAPQQEHSAEQTGHDAWQQDPVVEAAAPVPRMDPWGEDEATEEGEVQ